MDKMARKAVVAAPAETVSHHYLLCRYKHSITRLQLLTVSLMPVDAHAGQFGFERGGFHVQDFGRPALAPDAIV